MPTQIAIGKANVKYMQRNGHVVNIWYNYKTEYKGRIIYISMLSFVVAVLYAVSFYTVWFVWSFRFYKSNVTPSLTKLNNHM